MTAPTKEIMILGYERCKNLACGWKNIFFEDEGEPVPQLIAGISISCSYVCPICRSGDGAQRAVFGSGVPLDVIFPEEVEETPLLTEELQTIYKMTLRSHVRAAIRWVMPWSMDTQAWLIATLGLMLPFMCWGVISRDTFIINLVITFYLIVVGISFGYHLLITLPVFIAILFGQNKDKHRQFVLQEWQKFGIEPIFPLSAKKRADYRWLRSRGFGRKEAKRSAGYFFYN